MSLLGLFGRSVAVEIGPEGGVGLRHDGLRVGFRVEHKAGALGTATIGVYNPAPTTVALLRVPLATISLFAGYAPMPRLIFRGAPVRDGVDLQVMGPDRVLKVDAADGGRAFVETFIVAPYATPTTFGQVLELVLAQTRWIRGAIDPSLESVQLPHGVALMGKAPDIMDRLAAAVPPAGADWYVRDGALYVVARGTATTEPAPLLSSTQGNLIGSPNGTAKGIKVRALIDATMRPGRAFVVESLGWSGTYIAKDVTFTGDSGYENDFYMDLTGNPVGVP